MLSHPKTFFTLNGWRLKLIHDLLGFIALAALYRMARDADQYLGDFHVYWKGSRLWLMGLNPYTYTAQDQGFVFKYPPWILPLFAPIGLLSWETAKLAWFGVQTACCLFIALRTKAWGASLESIVICGLMFWWLLHGHFTAGQFTLVLTAVSLWAWPIPHPGASASLEKKSPALPLGLALTVTSAKVFSMYAWLGAYQKILRPSVLISFFTFILLGHFILLGISHFPLVQVELLGPPGSIDLTRFLDRPFSFLELNSWTHDLSVYYRAFFDAAKSGGAELGAEIVRGQGNHGLTALVLRTLKVESTAFATDTSASWIVFGILAYFWNKKNKRLSDAERAAGWIALGLISHPLAWHHSFVMAYPLMALTFTAAGQIQIPSIQKAYGWATFFSASCIALFVPQVIGKTLVKPLELAGMKSWGVVLLLFLLVRIRNQVAPHLQEGTP